MGSSIVPANMLSKRVGGILTETQHFVPYPAPERARRRAEEQKVMDKMAQTAISFANERAGRCVAAALRKQCVSALSMLR